MILECLAEKYSVSSTRGDVSNETLKASEYIIDYLEEDDVEDIPAYELEICW